MEEKSSNGNYSASVLPNLLPPSESQEALLVLGLYVGLVAADCALFSQLEQGIVH